MNKNAANNYGLTTGDKSGHGFERHPDAEMRKAMEKKAPHRVRHGLAVAELRVISFNTKVLEHGLEQPQQNMLLLEPVPL